MYIGLCKYFQKEEFSHIKFNPSDKCCFHVLSNVTTHAIQNRRVQNMCTFIAVETGSQRLL